MTIILHNGINNFHIQPILRMVYFDQEKVLIPASGGAGAGESSCLLNRGAVFGAALRFNRGGRFAAALRFIKQGCFLSALCHGGAVLANGPAPYLSSFARSDTAGIENNNAGLVLRVEIPHGDTLALTFPRTLFSRRCFFPENL